MKKRPPSGGLFAFLSWRREASPLRGLRGGFEGLAPEGAGLSESSDCHRCAVARRQALRAAQKFLPTLFHVINFFDYRIKRQWLLLLSKRCLPTDHGNGQNQIEAAEK
jgi:hypothetical protein